MTPDPATTKRTPQHSADQDPDRHGARCWLTHDRCALTAGLLLAQTRRAHYTDLIARFRAADLAARRPDASSATGPDPDAERARQLLLDNSPRTT